MRNVIIVAVVFALAMPMAALAQGFGGGPRGGEGGPSMRGPGGPGGKGPRMAEELGLTEEQMSKMRDIHSKNRKTMIDQKATIQKAMLDLTDELQKEKPDKAAVEKSIEQIVKTKADIERAKLNSMVELSALLTPEQKKKAAEKMVNSQLMGGMGGGMGPRGGGGPGGPGGPGFMGQDTPE